MDITVSILVERRMFMIYVGIDIAEINLFASAISSDSEVLIEPFKFTNDNDGFFQLFSKLNSFDKNSLIISLKSTTHYGNNLLVFLVPYGFHICLINLIQTSTMRKNNIRKTKTNKINTFIIYKTLMMQPHRFVTLYDISLILPKNLGRFTQKTTKQRTRMSKRGSRVFRYALVNAAHNVVKNSQTFKEYYTQKSPKDVPITIYLVIVLANWYALFTKGLPIMLNLI